MQPERASPCSQQPTPGPFPSLLDPVHAQPVGSSPRPPIHPISVRSISTLDIPTRSKRSVSFCPSRFPSKDLKQELNGHKFKDDLKLQTVARRWHRKRNCINKALKSSPNDKNASAVEHNMWKKGWGYVTMKCELFVLAYVIMDAKYMCCEIIVLRAVVFPH